MVHCLSLTNTIKITQTRVIKYLHNFQLFIFLSSPVKTTVQKNPCRPQALRKLKTLENIVNFKNFQSGILGPCLNINNRAYFESQVETTAAFM